MAEDLDDGEFWLPSQFLTDDDIVMDFSPSNKGSLGFGSDLDLPSNGSVTGSTETESEEDDLLAGLTRQMACSVIRPDCAVHSKGWTLSSSPQSTLCGCIGKESSSWGSPNVPVSPPPSADKDGGATLDLLNKAAGEVARIKMKSEKTSRAGTGFFDCSNKGLLCPPPRTTTTNSTFFSPHQFPPLSHVPQQLRQQQLLKSQMNILRNKNNSNSNRPLGLPLSAWPPLQAQNQPIPSVPSMFMGQPGPKRESVGTGVFLPRRVTSPAETRKKPEGGNPAKTRNGKGSNNGSNSQHRRSSRPPTANQTEIRLPVEWTY